MTDNGVATGRPPARHGIDRISVALLSLTAFLVILALLGSQLRPSAPAPAAPLPRQVIVRREYLTTVVTRIVPDGAPAPAARAVTRTVSRPTVTTAPAPAATAPLTTRTSPTK
jgi:hypothetical protein